MPERGVRAHRQRSTTAASAARRSAPAKTAARYRRPARVSPARQAAPSRTARHAPFDLEGPERYERFTLIEFIWDIESGIQPVILAERKLLH